MGLKLDFFLLEQLDNLICGRISLRGRAKDGFTIGVKYRSTDKLEQQSHKEDDVDLPG